MKKLLIVLAGIVLPLFLLTAPVPVAAQFDPTDEACQGEAANSDICRSATNQNPISGRDGVILRVVNILSIVVGVASVIMIMIAGIKLIISGGDPNRVKNSRETIIYAVVGLVVVLIARPLIIFIINRT